LSSERKLEENQQRPKAKTTKNIKEGLPFDIGHAKQTASTGHVVVLISNHKTGAQGPEARSQGPVGSQAHTPQTLLIIFKKFIS